MDRVSEAHADPASPPLFFHAQAAPLSPSHTCRDVNAPISSPPGTCLGGISPFKPGFSAAGFPLTHSEESLEPPSNPGFPAAGFPLTHSDDNLDSPFKPSYASAGFPLSPSTSPVNAPVSASPHACLDTNAPDNAQAQTCPGTPSPFRSSVLDQGPALLPSFQGNSPSFPAAAPAPLPSFQGNSPPTPAPDPALLPSFQGSSPSIPVADPALAQIKANLSFPHGAAVAWRGSSPLLGVDEVGGGGDALESRVLRETLSAQEMGGKSSTLKPGGGFLIKGANDPYKSPGADDSKSGSGAGSGCAAGTPQGSQQALTARPAEPQDEGPSAPLKEGFSVIRARHQMEADVKEAAFAKSGAWRDFEVWEFPHFLSDDECATLLHCGQGRFRRSRIQNAKAGGSTTSNYRTSSTAWLDPNKEAPEVQRILYRIRAVGQRITGISDFGERASKEVQLVQYETGQQYQAHYDGRMLPDGTLEGRGTLLVYLNQGYEGGETYFPNIDLKIKPEAGKAVLWYTHITPDGAEDVRSKHAGLMVTHGTKYLCTQWFGLPA